jgi:GntR family transcriptional regulator
MGQLGVLQPTSHPAGAFANLRVDKSSPTPVYAQIAEAIRSVIQGVPLGPGSLLPPERVLCESFGVSRMTLREAYEIVEREGLIETQRGRGTFVAPKRLAKQQQEMRSFTEEIRARGGVPSSRLVSLRVQDASPAAREFFGLSRDERVFEIQRLRCSDGEPLALETVQIPCSLCPNLDRFDLVNHSLYKILEENYGLELTHCVEEISAGRPDPRHKKLLGLPASAAVLIFKRKTYTATETPVELGVSVYCGDAYSAIVRSVRAQS